MAATTTNTTHAAGTTPRTSGNIVLPWRQHVLRAWQAQAQRALVELRDMGVIEIKRTLDDFKREFEQLMADPVLQTSDVTTTVENEMMRVESAGDAEDAGDAAWMRKCGLSIGTIQAYLIWKHGSGRDAT